jgi:hypothetical protein
MIDNVGYDEHDRVDQPMPLSPGSDQDSGFSKSQSFWLVIPDPG